jgi:hypothetical protein
MALYRPHASLIHLLFVSAGILVIFWLDVTSALGVAVWALYILPLWYGSRLPILPRIAVPAIAAVCTLLIVLAWFIAPPGIDPSISLYNRMIGVGLLWALAIMVMRAALLDESLRGTQEAQARLAAIVETSSDAIVSKSLDGDRSHLESQCRADIRVSG